MPPSTPDTRTPLHDRMIARLAVWASARDFDRDQDPSEDTADEQLVRAFFAFMEAP